MFNKQSSSSYQPFHINLLSPVRFLCTALLLLLISGCGGSSGGGDSSANFSLSTQQLHFVADYQGNLPADQTIQLSWSDPDIAGFAYVFSSANPQPDWINLDASSSSSPAELTFSINTTNMTPGTYHATLPLYSGDISANPLAHKDISVSYTIQDTLTATPTSLDFEYAIGSASNPDSQTLTLGGQSINWSASSSATWLLVASNSGSAPGSLSLSVDPTGLAAGSYAATLTLTNTANNDTVDVAVNLSVSEPALVTDQSSLTFSAINGGDIAAQSLAIAINNNATENWTASSDQGWLILGKTSGTTADTIPVTVDPSVGPLASGNHTATITISSNNAGHALTAAIPVQLTLTQATLTLNPTTVMIGGIDGLDESAQSVSISLDTDANAYAWSAQLTGNWLLADKTSGTTSASADQLSLDADRSSVVGGTYQGEVEVSVVINGDSIQQTLPITFNLEAHKLFIADNGVAMVSTPGVSKLSRTLKVMDTLDKSTAWTAVSDQGWLTASSSGMTGGDLVLTADTSGLATDQLYLANVTVSSSDTTVENSEVVRVGLWIGSADANASDSINAGYSKVIADPIRPYVYVHNAGTDIDVFNVYTATQVTTISNVGTQLGNMTISKDGSTLYVMDSSTQTLQPVDLDNYTSADGWLISGSDSAPYLSYTRVKATDFVLTSNGHPYAATDGSEASASYVVNNVLASSREGDTLCGVNTGLSPYTLSCYRLGYTALNGGLFQLSSSASLSATDYVIGSNGQDVAVSADGTRIYVASGAPYNFIGYDFDGTTLTGDQTLAGQAYPNNVEFSDDDQLYAGASVSYGNHALNEDDIWVYDISSGNALFSGYVSGDTIHMLNRQLVVSGDGVRAITLVNNYSDNNPSLIFITAP